MKKPAACGRGGLYSIDLPAVKAALADGLKSNARGARGRYRCL